MTPLLRYALAGAVATAGHWALLLLLLLVVLVEALGVAPWWASGLGAVWGAQLAFVGNRRFTFAHRGARWPAWWRFMGTACLGAALGMVLVAGGVAVGLHYLLAQALATLCSLLLTYVVNRRWAFAT